MSLDDQIDAALRLGTAQTFTVRTFGEKWLMQREASGVRSVADDRGRWRTHVVPASFYDLNLEKVTRAMARGWLVDVLGKKSERTKKLLAPQTCANILNLLRCAFETARQDEILKVNVFRDLAIPAGRQAVTDDKWTVLYPEEQEALLSVIPSEERPIVEIAMGSGVREGELWSLHLSDVVLNGDPHLKVRFGGWWNDGPTPTKGGVVRRVPLFGLSLSAMRAWVKNLPKYAPKNPHGLVFPNRAGDARGLKPPHFWEAWLLLAGITRHVRWHDLRHTCASSLIAGWWGRAWSMLEVSRLLGHKNVSTTEGRYVHFADDFLTRAADETDATRRTR